jgi:hypothetical protein
MLSDDEIISIVEPHKQTFTLCWRSAFFDYATKYDETRIVHSPLTRALLLRDHCLDHVRQNFADKPYVTFVEKPNGLFCVEMSGRHLGIEGSVAARLKKLKPNMLTSNFPTRQSGLWDTQGPVFGVPAQLELFGTPIAIHHYEPAHINIGYLPNALWTDLEGVYATMPNGKRSIKWVVKISDDPSDGQAIIEMPIEPLTDKTKRVRVKKKDAQ